MAKLKDQLEEAKERIKTLEIEMAATVSMYERREVTVQPLREAQMTAILNECRASGWTHQELAELRAMVREYGVGAAKTAVKLANGLAGRHKSAAEDLPVALASLQESYAQLEKEADALVEALRNCKCKSAQ
jgi:chromosome segregation ATPase